MDANMTPQRALLVLVKATGLKTRQLTFQAKLFEKGILINSQTERAANLLAEIQTATLVLQNLVIEHGDQHVA